MSKIFFSATDLLTSLATEAASCVSLEESDVKHLSAATSTHRFDKRCLSILVCYLDTVDQRELENDFGGQMGHELVLRLRVK